MASTPEMTVGLEVHARLKTSHKIFCACQYEYGQPPNTLVCPVCLGLPGTLPVFNMAAAHLALRVGMALNCTIDQRSEFARKNYFYPDLPRNYQITQYRFPLCTGGHLAAEDELDVRLRRIHLEEDAGRTLHRKGGATRIDMNRAGTPLMEIVTEPDLKTGAQAGNWLRRLRQLLLFLGVCDGEMATGSLRCDANVGTAQRGVLVEIKNLNSFRAVIRAVDFERERLRSMLAGGEILRPETRLWDDKKQATAFMRHKEEAMDYRYFPEPDLPPLVLDDQVVEKIRATLPLLPEHWHLRLVNEYGLADEDSSTLCQTPELVRYFDDTLATLAELTLADSTEIAPLVCNWVRNDILQICTEQGLTMDEFPVPANGLAGLLVLVFRRQISVASAHKVLRVMVTDSSVVDAGDFVKRMEWEMVTDQETISNWCQEIIAAYTDQVEAYIAGKTVLFDFFVGKVMSLSKGKACPDETRTLLVSLLNNSYKNSSE